MWFHHDHSTEAIRERLEAGPRVSYLRDWVYGGIDGAVTTFAIVAGVVGANLSTGIILVASQVAGCRYCQAHMANLSKIYKASEEKIGKVWEFETSDLFSVAERAALRVAYSGAMAPSQATREQFDELYKHFDEGEVVEIVASISLFGFLNRWNDTMATELEELPAQVASDTIGGGFGWEAGKHET